MFEYILREIFLSVIAFLAGAGVSAGVFAFVLVIGVVPRILRCSRIENIILIENVMICVVVTGSNQENAAYPSGLCAERTTLFYANSQYPDQAVKTLAIAARTEQDFLDTPIPPCGACRQVLLETEKRFGKPMRILLYSKSDIYIMEGVSALLPLSFDGDYLTTN